MSRLEADRLEQMQWLVTEGRRWLANSDGSERELASGWTLLPWQKSLLIEQHGFRKRAARRFPFPEKWIWTEKGLAQASDWWCAGFKATLFPSGSNVVDACCGAGADLVALSQSHNTTGIDSDPVIAKMAASNAEAHGLNTTTIPQLFAANQLDASGWLHIDPDRRPLDLRTTVADEFMPPLQEILDAAEHARGTLIKLAPQTQFSAQCQSFLDERATRLWLGNMGECRQQLAVLGQCRDVLSETLRGLETDPALRRTQRLAVLAEPRCKADSTDNGLGGSQFCTFSFGGQAALSIEERQEPLAYIFDLHNVLHAADLQSAWAENAGLVALSSPQGYFTSDTALTSKWAQVFQVIDVVAWDDRKIRKTLRGLKAGIVEVKNRLVKLNANEFQRRYSNSTGERITLLVTQMDGRYKAVVAKRLSASSS